MLVILDSLNVHNFHIFQLILMILVSKFMVHRDLSDKTYLSLGLLSSLTQQAHKFCKHFGIIQTLKLLNSKVYKGCPSKSWTFIISRGCDMHQ